ncbi:MAG TPA: biotin/lipoyl-containing protein [Bdellovibrionota bacterium]|nr:biotin/lipoyl-containing protein [Bdellovibrionota bacterium]
MNFEATIGKKSRSVKVTKDDGHFIVFIDQLQPIFADLVTTPTGYNLVMQGRSYRMTLASENHSYSIQINGELFELQMVSEFRKLQQRLRGQELAGAGTIIAKMPGKIVKVLAKVGDEVHDGQSVLIMEAMKMENELRSPSKGKIKEIRVKEGDTVEAGALLVVLE